MFIHRKELIQPVNVGTQTPVLAHIFLSNLERHRRSGQRRFNIGCSRFTSRIPASGTCWDIAIESSVISKWSEADRATYERTCRTSLHDAHCSS
jgi:hypothetical protein